MNKAKITVLLEKESAGGILLIFAAVLALIIANSPFHALYDLLISTRAGVSIGDFAIDKPILLWINDGLMAVFFFVVGLELKRELLEGRLTQISAVTMPLAGAVGGMLVPAAFYLMFTHHDPLMASGWAIPAATDIAFALGILGLLGDRVPPSLKIFLVTLAILDDIGAIVIIALFYTDAIATVPLIIAAVCVAILFTLNRARVCDTPPYIMVAIVLWIALLKSGVHATLAGVMVAFFIPMRDKYDPQVSPVRNLEHGLHKPVAFVILPLFAFANSGLNIFDMSLDSLVHPVTLGITAGLFLGKQIGVFGFVWLAVKLRIAKLPAELNWGQIYGVAILCGVGFTMSLFIGSLAFEQAEHARLLDERLGILLASTLSAFYGYFLLKRVSKTNAEGD